MNEDITYKVYVHDRVYSKWTFYNTLDFQECQLSIHPSEHKLFTNDVIVFNDNQVKIIHSSVRLNVSMPGVLILKNNKTYGRKNGKLLYKCIPDDMRLPAFLVPYEMKHIGFSKVYQNIYVTFHYCEWNDKHPHGTISHSIGPVDILDNFYEYQLYCKSLNASIQKFTKDTNEALKNQSHEDFIHNITNKYPSIIDRCSEEWFVFSIDPPKSVDFDDAFSIKKIDENQGIHQVSIYISNVTIWMDVLNLWDSFSRRISTIYLPDKKRPMLPTILSDCLCSLQENNTRIAFVMDVFIKEDEIIDIKYSNCKIKVSKNYCYEESSLLKNIHYQNLLELMRKISKKYKYINHLRNSHDLVSYLMILMNYNTAKKMIQCKNGIFRSTIMKRDIYVPENLPEDVVKFMKIWNSTAGQYIDVASLHIGQTISHDFLEMEAYIHITSPIRRLVDLLNIIQFQQNNQMVELTEHATHFYHKWLNELEYINTTMRSIRKVQNDCSLLDMCMNQPEIMEKQYTGYTFDKIVRNDGLYQFVVFLPELKLTCRITIRDNLENYQEHKYKLYLFNDEDNLKKKIRLQLL